VEFWENGVVRTVLLLAVLLAVAEIVRGLAEPLRRIGLPASIIAGAIGLVVGPGLMGWLPMDGEVLKTGVYHALGIVFIAVSLQTPAEGAGGGGGKAMAFGITVMAAVQTIVGLGIVLVLGTLAAQHMHPGMGLILPIGFEQGPGQALSLGAAWEKAGMTSGADVGLIVAAIGFVWSIAIGVPLVIWGRYRGLIGSSDAENTAATTGPAEAEPALPAGSLELLTRQIVIVGAVYALTLAACSGLSVAFGGPAPGFFAERVVVAEAAHSGGVPLWEEVWGFHFMIGALLAMGVRPLLGRLPGGTPVHDGLMSKLGSVTVDFATVAALSAVQLSVLTDNWLPILLVTSVGGGVTLVVIVWLSRRAYADAPFEHCVLWFGMATGTLPMGLALLRIVDPELKSPAPTSAVIGSAGAIIGVAPLLLGVHQIALAGWGENYPAAGWITLAVTSIYLLVTLALWWKFGGLRAGLSPLALWPQEAVADR